MGLVLLTICWDHMMSCDLGNSVSLKENPTEQVILWSCDVTWHDTLRGLTFMREWRSSIVNSTPPVTWHLLWCHKVWVTNILSIIWNNPWTEERFAVCIYYAKDIATDVIVKAKYWIAMIRLFVYVWTVEVQASPTVIILNHFQNLLFSRMGQNLWKPWNFYSSIISSCTVGWYEYCVYGYLGKCLGY